MRDPIFIVGMPRSGTSLLSTLLHAHSELAVAPETHYFTRCWEGPTISDDEEARRLLECLLRQPGVRDMALTDDEIATVRRTVESAPEPSHRAIFTSLLEVFVQKHGGQRWGEKTPAHLEYVQEISTAFPEAVFLVLLRDPRDVSLSLRKMPWNHRRTVFDHARRWAHYARLTRAYRHQPSLNVQVVRYEQLIERPEEVLRKVCRTLGVGFEPGMLMEDQQEKGALDPEREPWKEKALRPIDPTNKEKWRTEMSRAERKVVEWQAGAEMEAWGYPTENLSWGPSMLGPLLKIGGQLLRKHWHRFRLHVLRPTSPLEMPWRSEKRRSS